LFILAPGGEKTKHIVNEDFLKKMKKTSILVNTSRGTLVDSDALGKALREGWIWGAGLDVVEGEPNVTADHPLVKEPRYDQQTSNLVLILIGMIHADVSFCPTLVARRWKHGWAWLPLRRIIF